MSLADAVSIPSTLANPGPGAPHVTCAERRERHLREAGLAFAECPACGQRATREEVLVHRPGQVSVMRVVLRCMRPGRAEYKGRTLPGTRCPVRIESETPIQGEEEETQMETSTPTLCACGCGESVSTGRKFASQRCANSHNMRKRREAALAEKEPEERVAIVVDPEEETAPPRPELAEKVREAAATTRNAVSLLALAAQLLELTADEADLVARLVAAERVRRAA